MDPLFERRELEKKVHIDSKYIQNNMNASILAQLKMNYEGRCSPEGYIERNSITLVSKSLGRANYVKGGADYDVKFQADVCFPHPGQQLKARVTVRSKVGIHAETPPIKVLIPRDLYFGNEDFAKIQEGDDIEFEVVGAQFKQKDPEIIVVGKLLGTPEQSVPEPQLVMEDTSTVVVPQTTDGEKQVVVQPVAPEGEKKKRRLRKGGGDEGVTFTTLPPPPA